MFELEDFRLWIIDRYEPEELLLHLNITTEDLLDAFPEEWEENRELINSYGVNIDEEDE